MSDLVERLRKKKYASAKPPYDRYQVNPDGPEAANEIERLQALYDKEKAAHHISVDEAIASARRQAFIEAAEIAEESAGGSGELLALASKGKDVVGALCHSEGLMTAKIIVAALRAKAEETQG